MHATIDDVERPDHLAFNLKPREQTDWRFVCETALKLNTLLKRAGYRSWPKTTGGDELHLLAPIAPNRSHDEVRAEAKEIAGMLAASNSRYTLSSTEKRMGTLLIDCQRNAYGATSIGVYSPRAMKGFPVATRVPWPQIKAGISPARFTMAHPKNRTP